ncbi:MAG: L,D-transpeptidase family protein [Actinomycetota bacterium]
MRQGKLARFGAATVVAAAVAAAGLPSALAQPAPLPVTLTVQLSQVRLFEEAIVSGLLDPPHPGASVQVALLLGERAGERRSVPLSGDGSAFQTEVPVEKWGRYRAQVTFEGDSDHAPAEVTTEPKKVRTPRAIHAGANGDLVLALESRLEDLGYHLPRPNRNFDHRTGDAVLAFHKVNGMSRGESVSKATWKRLSDPRTPRPRVKRPREHIEVDQSKQVLYVVREGEIEEIVHVSTGAGGATRDGVFNVHRKIAGFSPNRLYYPSYFDGTRAVHGWPDVPPSPASHGCVRVPYWVAKWIFAIMHYGIQVRVYH